MLLKSFAFLLLLKLFAAIISGFKNSSAQSVMIFMADDHINHNIINLCYEKFKEGYAVVCPSRFIKDGKMIGNSFLKGSKDLKPKSDVIK